MLYGLDLQVPTDDRDRFSRYYSATLQLCMAANRDAHQHVKYPQNYQALPALLKARIKGSLSSDLGGDHLRKAWRATAAQNYRQIGPRAAPPQVEGEPFNYHNYYRRIGPAVSELQSGNCGEYTALVVNMLLRRGVQEQRIRLLKGNLGRNNNHICLVVDIAEAATPGDRDSFGTDAVVCDGWLDLVVGPSVYFRVLDQLQCDFEPNQLATLADLVA